MNKQMLIKKIEDKVATAWEPVRTEFLSYLVGKTQKELQETFNKVTVSSDGKDIRLF